MPAPSRHSESKHTGVHLRLVGLIVVLIAASARMLVVHDIGETVYFANPTLDAQTNWAAALQWVDGEGPSRPFFKAPLYPWLISWIIRASAPFSQRSDEAIAVVVILQHLMGIAAAWLVWRIANALAGALAGFIAGCAAGLAGALIFFEGDVLDVALVSTLMLGGMALLTCAPVPLSLIRISVAGLLLGLGVITRPTLAAPLLLAVPWCVAVHISHSGWLRAMGRAVLLIAPGCFLVGLVAWANGGETLIATYGGPNFWLANHPGADGFSTRVPQIHGVPREGEDYIERFARIEAAAQMGRDEVSATEAARHWWGEGLRFWREEPASASLMAGRRALLFWQGPEIKSNRDIDFVGTQVAALGALQRCVNWRWLAPLGLVGLWLALRVPLPGMRPGSWLLLIALAALFLAALPFPINTRYRAPALPLLCIGSGVAISFLALSLYERRWRAVLLVLGWSGGLIAAMSLDWTGIDRSDTSRDWYQLGNLALQRGNRERGDLLLAERAYREALSQDPAHLESSVNLARVWIEEGKQAQAQEHLRSVIALAPDYPVAWSLLGQSHAQAGEAVSAEVALREALRLDSTLTTPALHLTWIMLGQGRSGEARLLTERLRALGETGAELAVLSAWALAEEGDTAAARSALRDAERAQPGIGERALPTEILNRLQGGGD